MFLQGKFLTKWFAKIISVPVEVLTPIIVMFCFAGAFSVNSSLFDIAVTLVFAVIAYIINKLGFSTIPVLLGLVLGDLTEENFRRSLVLSGGKWSIFISSPICIVFLSFIIITVFLIVKSQFKDDNKGEKIEQK
jgi:putative tricarboxylic transport membrane protein